MSSLTTRIASKYKLPIVLVAIHGVAVLAMWLFVTICKPAEPEATWEYVCGAIDFVPYFLIAVPKFVRVGEVSPQWIEYAMYFLIVGSVQWWVFGVIISASYRAIRSRRHD